MIDLYRFTTKRTSSHLPLRPQPHLPPSPAPPTLRPSSTVSLRKRNRGNVNTYRSVVVGRYERRGIGKKRQLKIWIVWIVLEKENPNTAWSWSSIIHYHLSGYAHTRPRVFILPQPIRFGCDGNSGLTLLPSASAYIIIIDLASVPLPLTTNNNSPFSSDSFWRLLWSSTYMFLTQTLSAVLNTDSYVTIGSSQIIKKPRLSWHACPLPNVRVQVLSLWFVKIMSVIVCLQGEKRRELCVWNKTLVSGEGDDSSRTKVLYIKLGTPPPLAAPGLIIRNDA